MRTPIFIGMIKNMRESYEVKCRDICKEYQLSQSALDILLLLTGKNEVHTAKDIHQILDMKPNLISLNVEKLVQDGYVVRHNDEIDRRIVNLESTEKAQEIYLKGRLIQEEYLEDLYKDISEEEYECFIHCLNTIHENALKIMQRK